MGIMPERKVKKTGGFRLIMRRIDREPNKSIINILAILI